MSNLLGNKIKKLRKEKKQTLDALAKEANISKSYLWELENSDAKKPSAEILNLIAIALDVTTDFLLNNTNVDADEQIKDEGFYRNYQNLQPDQKNQLRSIMDILRKSENKNDS